MKWKHENEINSRLEVAEENISEPEDGAVETTEIKKQRKKVWRQ